MRNRNHLKIVKQKIQNWRITNQTIINNKSVKNSEDSINNGLGKETITHFKSDVLEGKKRLSCWMLDQKVPNIKSQGPKTKPTGWAWRRVNDTESLWICKAVILSQNTRIAWEFWRPMAEKRFPSILLLKFQSWQPKWDHPFYNSIKA